MLAVLQQIRIGHMNTAVVRDVPRRLNTVRQQKSIRMSQHSRECPAPTRPDDRATSAVPPLLGVPYDAPQSDLQAAQLHRTAAVHLAACLKLSSYASFLSAVTAQLWFY